MRLKEIQAKCRTQEMKSGFGMQPVKALREKMTLTALPSVEAMEAPDVLKNMVSKKN